VVPLPFQVPRVFPLRKALLLFRSQEAALIHSQYSDFPVLFTLFHPLEEIRTVAFFAGVSQASPAPRSAVIPSPRKGDGAFADEPLRFITDPSFLPLSVTREKCFLLARSQGSVGIWRFVKPKGTRDLLFSSPAFGRPSVFSPGPKAAWSPGAARAGVGASIEGVPPDLFMEMVFELG